MLPITKLVSLFSGSKHFLTAGRSCEVLHVVKPPLQAGRPSYNILMLPGNPGLPSYYRKFVECLYPQLPHAEANFRISVMGLMSHSSIAVPSSSPFTHFGIEDQKDFVTQYVLDDCSRDPSERTILIGHSIGAYFGFEALRRMEIARRRDDESKCAGRIVSFVGLMPFLEANDASPHYRRLKFILHFFWPIIYVLGFIAQLLSFAPTFLKRLILLPQTASMDPDIAAFTATSMLSFRVICNFLWLGKTEFDHHGRQSFDFSNANSAIGNTELRLLYTDGDFWAPEECHSKALAGGIASTFLPGQKHAFGVTVKSAEPVANWMADHITETVKQERQKGGEMNLTC